MEFAMTSILAAVSLLLAGPVTPQLSVDEVTAPALPRDSLLAALPLPALKVVEYWFPNHWCVRLVTHHKAHPKWYQATLFTPSGPRRTTNWIGETEVDVPPMYEVSVTAEG